MTGIIWACAATFIAACVPILAKVGTKRQTRRWREALPGLFYVRLYFFTGKII